ncbi:MAG TPA: hypothetical protein DCW90_09890 [Lachnospiraceae bacterium]|nr:hypothetical protein [Lachnospiraceae bacterium]
MNKTICFADNTDLVRKAFKDYFFQYMDETGKMSNMAYSKVKSFSEKEKDINALMNKEIQKLSGINFASDSVVSKEMLSQNPNYQWATFAVVNSLIDMIIPDVLDKSIGIYTETKYINWGDSALFTVKPNDLFYVSKAGRNQRTVEFQRQFNTQVSVVPENREITVDVNFYRMLCGYDSLAEFVMKAILSLEAQITRDVYTAFDTAMEALPAAPAAASLKVAGWSQASAVRLAQVVTAYNHGSKAMFVGTQGALQNVLPDNANYRYGLDSDYVTLGYVKNAFGFDCLVLPQIAIWDDMYKLGLRDDRIYVMSPASQSIVKLVYEGNTISNTVPAQLSANLTEQTTLMKSYGIGIATNATVGEITL